MSAIIINGELVHYEKLGRGRPVILVHGWIGSWRYWIPLMRQLQLKFTVYALDLFGYGDSSKNLAYYGLSDQVDLLHSFTKKMMDNRRVALIGHGLGTMVITQYAAIYPERVHRIMLNSAPLFEVDDLENRRMPDQPRLLTPSNAADPFPGSEGYDDNESSEDKTLMRRPGGLDGRIGSSSAADVTVPSASQKTYANPKGAGIERDLLRQAALQRGNAVLTGDDEQGASIPAPGPLHPGADNPLSRALGNDPAALLARCFKRSEAPYEKLQVDVAKMDGNAISYVTQYFDPGDMLDTLRSLNTPMVITHGTQDPLIELPPPAVWEYLTLERDDRVVPVPLEGVRHFPMLEYEPFSRMVASFLETTDLTKLDMKERWRRRTR